MTQAPATQKTSTPIDAPHPLSPAASRVAALLRIAYGFVFLWAFFDKVFGWHYATPAGKGWIDGGNPTKGFLMSSTGPFSGFYHSIAGAGWVNWLFMLGLLGIGVALILGIGMRFAAVAGGLMYLMMWAVVLPPATNPIIDDHILGLLTLVLLTLIGAGHTWGLGRAWDQVELVQKYPVLR